MALPRMNSDTAVVDRVPGAHEVTTTTTICEARAQLHITGETVHVFDHAAWDWHKHRPRASRP
jgi:hypothetical protein